MRGVKESGRSSRSRRTSTCSCSARCSSSGSAVRTSATSTPCRSTPEAFDGHARRAAGPSAIFLLLEGILVGRGRAHRSRGDLERRARVPAARSRRTRRRRWCGWASCSARCSSAISVLAHRLEAVPEPRPHGHGAIGLAVFGNGPVFVVLQFATAAILTLAANTAYNGFPGLSSIIAKDGYLPRQLANRGDRLVFSNGIIVLAGPRRCCWSRSAGSRTRSSRCTRSACSRRSRSRRSGMVRHHLQAPRAGVAAQRRAQRASARSRPSSSCSSSRSPSSRAARGSRSCVIPLIVLLFKAIHRHYDARRRERLQVPPDYKPPRRRNTVVVLVGTTSHAGVLEALAYAQSIAPEHVIAVTVVADVEDAEQLEKQWAEQAIHVPLEVVRLAGPELHQRHLALHRRARTPVGRTASSRC